jgi:predicted secreted protein
MTLYTGIMVYLVIWWTVIFAVLPWGNRPPDVVEKGHATSAPAKPRLAIKFAVTTVIAAILWVALDQAVRHGVMSFR